MCDYPPPPSLAAALLAAPLLWIVAGAVICPLGLWLVEMRIQGRAGRERPGALILSGVLLISYSAAALIALLLGSSLAWRAALLDWDVSQIDRLERLGCSIPTLEAVDGLYGQQASTADNLLRIAAVGALAATIFLLVRLASRLQQRST
jgi:hypothetical protein